MADAVVSPSRGDLSVRQFQEPPMAQDIPCASYVVRLEFESWASHTELELTRRLEEDHFTVLEGPTGDAKGFSRIGYQVCGSMTIADVLGRVRKQVIRAGMACSVSISRTSCDSCGTDCPAYPSVGEGEVVHAFLSSCQVPTQLKTRALGI
jgi:hypothetical protein